MWGLSQVSLRAKIGTELFMCSSIKQVSLCLLLLWALGSIPCMFINTMVEQGFSDSTLGDSGACAASPSITVDEADSILMGSLG